MLKNLFQYNSKTWSDCSEFGVSFNVMVEGEVTAFSKRTQTHWLSSIGIVGQASDRSSVWWKGGKKSPQTRLIPLVNIGEN